MALSLTKQASLLAASRAAGQVLNAAVGIVVVRHLSQTDFGTFRQIYLLTMTLMLLTDIGLVESLYYFVPRLPAKRATILLRSTLVVGVMQVLVGFVMMASRASIGRFFNNAELPAYMGLLVVYLGFSTITRLWEVQLIAEQRIPLASVVTGGFEALKVGLMFTVLALRPGLWPLVWALVAGTGIKFLCYLAFLLRDFRGFASARAGENGKEHFAYALALWLPGMINLLATQAHQFIVGYWFQPADFGLYSVACFQVPLVGVLTTSIIEVMLVRITTARAQGRHDDVVQVWNNATKKSMMIFIPMAVGFGVLASPLIVLLFTRANAAAAPLFAILMLGLPLNAIFTNNILRAYGEMADYTKFYTARLALGLLLGVAGVAWMGMWGAAISSVLALYVIIAWQLGRVARLLEVPFASVLPWKEIGKVALASFAGALPAGACAWLLSPPAVALAAGLPLFGIVYVVCAVKLGLIRRDEIQAVLDGTRAVFGRLGLLPAKTA